MVTYLNAVQMDTPPWRGINEKFRNLAMSNATITAFGRLMDRTGVALTLILGFALAGV